MSPEEILSTPFALPWQVRTEFIDIAGGIYNHEIIFDSMTPTKGTAPSKLLSDEITASFGDMDSIKKRFTDASNALVGTGYVMIIKNPSGSLNVISMPNEESSVIDRMYPILMLDLWEHAYASNFFERKNYINKWFVYKLGYRKRTLCKSIKKNLFIERGCCVKPASFLHSILKSIKIYTKKYKNFVQKSLI